MLERGLTFETNLIMIGAASPVGLNSMSYLDIIEATKGYPLPENSGYNSFTRSRKLIILLQSPSG